MSCIHTGRAASFRVLWGPLQKAAATTGWAKGSCMCCYTAWDEVMHKVGQRANTRMEYEYMVVYACSVCIVISFVLQRIPNPLWLCPLWEANHHESVSMKARNTHIQNWIFIYCINFLCMTEAQANFKFLFRALSGYGKILENEYVHMTALAHLRVMWTRSPCGISQIHSCFALYGKPIIMHLVPQSTIRRR